VEMLGYQPQALLRRYMAQAKAFLFAAEEDFGITPVEAQACGTPVLAYGRGGALETVLDGVTGRFFVDQTAESVADLIADWEPTAAEFDPGRIRTHACGFSKARFRRCFAELVERHWSTFERGRRLPSREPDVCVETGVSNHSPKFVKPVVCEGQP
jgi:glycosyltransferase involved in cell wall biosynthesis